MISGKKRAISWNENTHDVRTLLYSLQFVVARQLRILKSKKRVVFLNFADICEKKTLDIRDVFEKKGSDHKKLSKKDVALNVNMLSSKKKLDVL